MIYKLANEVATVTEGASFSTDRYHDERGIFQCAITGTATVKLEGRCSPEAPWVEVIVLQSSGAAFVSIFPQMRVNITECTGTVSAWLAE